jgi:hypothetical protein
LQVRQRTIESGNIQELLHFNNAITIQENKSNNPFGRNGTGEWLPPEEQEKKEQDNRDKTLKRNISKLWRLYNCNKGQYNHKDKFLTLTFRILPDTLEAADYELKKFLKKLKYYSKTKIEHLGVRELQMLYEREGIHYHIIIFNMPYIPHKLLLKMWCKNNSYMDAKKPSGVNIKGIRDGYEEMTNYLTSYQLKDLVDNDFIKGHKTLLKSRGLIKPTTTNYCNEKYLPELEDIKKGLSFMENRITYYRLNDKPADKYIITQFGLK